MDNLFEILAFFFKLRTLALLAITLIFLYASYNGNKKDTSTEFCNKVTIRMPKTELDTLALKYKTEELEIGKGRISFHFGHWAISSYICEVSIDNNKVVSKKHYESRPNSERGT